MRCESERCANQALYMSNSCWDHLADKGEYKRRLVEKINQGADLTGANLQKADLKETRMEKAILSKANLSQANLTSAHLFDCKLREADLVGADLAHSDMTHCDLAGSDMTKAILTNARLWNADLEGANLTESNLEGADLWNARLYKVKLWRAVMNGARSLTIRNFSDGAKPFTKAAIDEDGLVSAEDSYRNLKSYFLANGMYNDASWASFKEKAMERLILMKKRDLKFFPSAIMNILCGYGEKPYRIIISAFGTIMLFAFIYASLNAVENSAAQNYILRWSDYIYYSTITFTTVGYGDFVPKGLASFRLLAASEAFLGVFLTGLFIFTLARKYSAR